MGIATKSQRYIVTIYLTLFCTGCNSDNEGSSSWAKLKISPETFGSFEYGNLVIEIYEHANNNKLNLPSNQKKYFYSPMALLDNNNAVSFYNIATKQSELRFRIEMWNDKVQNEVVKYLNENFGQEIISNQVRIIPLEKVILTSNIPTTDYSLPPFWTNYDKGRNLGLYLSFYDQEVCDELANQMRTDPQIFDHLKLLYSLSSLTSQTKQTTISIDSVTSGKLVTTLLQKFKDKNEVFLTAKDEKKMLTESATNIRMDTLADSEVGSPDMESQILNILKGLLVTSRTTIEKQSEKMWDSVFWNDDNYRPDKTTKTLNQIVNKLDSETQKKLTNMFQKADKQSDSSDNLNASNKDARKKGEEKILRNNQSKNESETEERNSQATDEEQFSHDKTENDQSHNTKADTGADFKGFGVSVGGKVIVETGNKDITERDNTKTDKLKNESEEINIISEKKEKNEHNYDSNSWADVEKISSTISRKMSNDSDSSRRLDFSKNEIEKLLKESKEHVQWDGENFLPKPMQVSRINLAQFRDSQSFQDRNVRVSYSTAELAAPIRFMKHAKLAVTDEWKNLKDELKATTKLLTTTIDNLSKTDAELSNVKSDLTNKLEVAKVEFEKSKIDLNNISAHLNEINQELLKTRAQLTKNSRNSNQLRQDLKYAEEGLRQDLKATEEKLERDLRTTSNNLESTNTNLGLTRIELSSTKSAVADLATIINERTSEVIEIARMPTSCKDLQQTGHKLSGFFLVNGSKKMEIVFCEFYPNKNANQKWIGHADVKLGPVHFHVNRNSSFHTAFIPVPFELALKNEGNAMNITSGIFTAPRPGIYFFYFMGMAYLNSLNSTTFHSCLYLNENGKGNIIWTSFIHQNKSPVDQFIPVSFQSTMQLNKGDEVWISIQFSSKLSHLYDDGNHWTHFSGLLLEEDIAVTF